MKFSKFLSLLKNNRSVSSTATPQNQNNNNVPRFPSLDIAFDLIQKQLDQQISSMDSSNDRAKYIQTSATTLLAASLVLEGILFTQQIHHQSPVFLQYIPVGLIPLIILLPVLALYIASMIYSSLAYNIKTFKAAPNAQTIIIEYLKEPEEKTKMDVVRAMENACTENEGLLLKKSKRNSIASVLMMVEAILLVLLILLQVSILSN